MGRKSLVKTIAPYYLVIIAAAIATVVLFSSNRFKSSYLDRLAQELESRSQLFSLQIEPLLQQPESSEAIDAACKRVGNLTQTRLTVIAADGIVLGDSDENPSIMENHGSRPEVIEARRSGYGLEVRFSNTLQQEFMYVAVPLKIDGELAAIVRSSLPVSDIGETLSQVNTRVIIIGIIVIIIALVLSFLVFRQVTSSLQLLREGANKFAEGRFDERLTVSNIAEIGDLATAMNRMASLLDDRIRTIVEQRNTIDTVFVGMTDGLIAVDASETIIDINPAACRLFGLDRDASNGKSIQEVFRNIELIDFTRQTLSSDLPVSDRIVLRREKDMHLQAHGSPLTAANGTRLGGVIVLSDLTPIYRLENIRREFVSNVSHELKTPITAIRGFAETVLEGDERLSAQSRSFLDRVVRQSMRLHTIIEDLLTLSRLEHQEEQIEGQLSLIRIKPILEAVVEPVEAKRSEKEITIRIECQEQLKARLSQTLMEQAVINLVDNAIRFSKPGYEIVIRANEVDEEVVIEVEDQGAGIEKKHIPRLFERFYRVDKARSRTAGGSGLGLALVKHIALVHSGRVSVDSEPGRGSIFRIHLPSPRLQTAE